MPQQAWSKKRERQYEHIKDSQEDRGTSVDRAEEIAARSVNKDRARSGESRQRGNVSVGGESPEQRGGRRSGRGLGPGGPTKAQLYNDAKQRGVKGRSKMSKAELERALGRT